MMIRPTRRPVSASGVEAGGNGGRKNVMMLQPTKTAPAIRRSHGVGALDGGRGPGVVTWLIDFLREAPRSDSRKSDRALNTALSREGRTTEGRRTSPVPMRCCTAAYEDS
jgi:hypothetical protein